MGTINELSLLKSADKHATKEQTLVSFAHTIATHPKIYAITHELLMAHALPDLTICVGCDVFYAKQCS